MKRILQTGAVLLLVLSSVTSYAADVAFDSLLVAPGVEYFHKQVKNVPWSVHVARVEWNRRDIQIATSLPEGNRLGLSKTTEQMAFLPRHLGAPVAAINGDFFSWRKGPYQGDPMGLQIMHGELTSGPVKFSKKAAETDLGGVAFWIDSNGKPQLGLVAPHFEVIWPNGVRTPFVFNQEREDKGVAVYTHITGSSTRTTNGVELIIDRAEGTALFPFKASQDYTVKVRAIRGADSPLATNILVVSVGPKLKSKLPPLIEGMTLVISTATSPSLKNVQTAMGGGPRFVRNGEVVKQRDDPRHPRAAMGFNDKYIFFVAVDGRRQGISDGMTFSELAAEMKWWGCTDAMNLDGGGSAMLWVDGQIRNQPSENRERPCANALVALRKTGSRRR